MSVIAGEVDLSQYTVGQIRKPLSSRLPGRAIFYEGFENSIQPRWWSLDGAGYNQFSHRVTKSNRYAYNGNSSMEIVGALAGGSIQDTGFVMSVPASLKVGFECWFAYQTGMYQVANEWILFSLEHFTKSGNTFDEFQTGYQPGTGIIQLNFDGPVTNLDTGVTLSPVDDVLNGSGHLQGAWHNFRFRVDFGARRWIDVDVDNHHYTPTTIVPFTGKSLPAYEQDDGIFRIEFHNITNGVTSHRLYIDEVVLTDEG